MEFLCFLYCCYDIINIYQSILIFLMTDLMWCHNCLISRLLDKINKILRKIQLRRGLSSMETSHRPAPNMGAPPSTTKKCQPHSPTQKLKEILDCIKAANWMLSKFFYYLFQLESDNSQPIVQESQHKQMVTRMLNGTSKPSFGVIIDLIHWNAGHVDYRKDDETSLDRVFQPGILPDSIKHAKPALTVWAVHLVSSLVQAEGQQMIK